MLMALGVALLVAWGMGFLVFHIAGGIIHLLLILAVGAIIWHFVTGRRTAV